MDLINDSIKNKKVLLRLDLNVTIKDNKILDDSKIVKSLKTINYLLNNNNSLIILSHLGKIKSEEDKEKNTLYPVYLKLNELLDSNVYFSHTPKGVELDNMVNNLKEKEILLVENTRFLDYPEKLESSCDESLSKYWANLCDVFVDDAFGTSHRKHASNYGIKKYVKSFYGFLINEETSKLNELIKQPERPFTVIMGGAKVDDKVTLIESILKECDYLIVAGGIANTFLLANDEKIGASIRNEEFKEKIKEIISINKNKIIIPIDFFVDNNGKKEYRKKDEIKDEDVIYDIGPESIEEIKKIIDNSRTIFINGTVGLYENDLYKDGTDEVLKIISESKAKTFAGGGDAIASIKKLGYDKSFYYISTGGGATLEYIINKKALSLEE